MKSPCFLRFVLFPAALGMNWCDAMKEMLHSWCLFFFCMNKAAHSERYGGWKKGADLPGNGSLDCPGKQELLVSAWSPVWGGINHSGSADYRQSHLPRTLDNNGLTQRLRLVKPRVLDWLPDLKDALTDKVVFVPHIRHDIDSDKWKCLRLNSQKYCIGLHCTSAAFVWRG